MKNKLYVGNLAFETTEDDLQALFAEAGAITSVELMKDRGTDRSRGFAFVVMGTRAEAQTAVQMFNGKALNERELTVHIAKPTKKRARFNAKRGGRRRR